MATYNVTAPDGTKYQITAPDDATQDQVMAYAQQQHVAPQSNAANPDDVTRVSQLYHQAVAAGNDIAASHFQGWLQAHGAQPTAPDAQTQAKVADIQQTAQGSNAALGNGVGGSLAGAGLGLVHHLANIPIGVAQLATNVAAKGGDLVGTHALDSAAQGVNQYVQNREQNYQDITKGNVGSYVGGAVGEIVPWLVGAGELRAATLLPKAETIAAKAAPYVGTRIAGVLGKAAPLAGEGALYGAVQPVTNGDTDYGAQKAEQIGTAAIASPLLAGATVAALKAPGAVRNVADYLTEAGRNRLAGKKFADLVDSAAGDNGLSMLRGAAQTVPGEQVSLASAIPNARSVQIERALQNDPNAGPIMADARASNNALRLQAIGKMAGTDADMQAALEAREKATQPFIDAHLNYLAPAQRWNTAGQSITDALDNGGRMSGEDFNTLKQMQNVVQQVKSGQLQEDDGYQALSELGQSLKSKAGQQAFDDAGQAIHSNMVDARPVLNLVARMRNSNLGQNPTIRNALNTVETNLKQAQHTLGSDPTSGTGGLVPASVLDGIRSQLSGSLKQFAPNAFSGVGEREAAGLAPLRSALVDTLNGSIPGYSRYLSAYARTSEPVNTFESLRELLDNGLVGGRNVAGDPQATRHALDVFLRKVDRSPYGISPQAKAQITALRDSLARENISNNKVSSAGSDTGANLRMAPVTRTLSGKVGSALGSAAGLTISHLLGVPFAGDLTSTAIGSIAGAGLTRAANDANAKIAARVGQLAADSRAGASAVDAVQRAKNARPSIAQILYENALPYGKPRVPLNRLLGR